jgi:NAD(P)-dependent dehydrogenase (short-subunit alcohol dehydrogenase family)
MAVILVTGASSGIGNAISRALADAGHVVYASMRDVTGHNAHSAAELERNDLHIIELDVTDQASCDGAVAAITATEGRLDVVVHNAGHLARGFAEAFTAAQIAALFDVNTLGQHRVNRACLPVMRRAQNGYLIYVGSTTTPVPPPFMAPYATTKAAGETLALTTGYELRPFGIETTIVMPGALPTGTNHSAHATQPADANVVGAYRALEPLIAQLGRHIAATTAPDASPDAVGRDVVRLVALPEGSRPLRSFVDFQRSGLERITDRADEVTAEVFATLGITELLPNLHS